MKVCGLGAKKKKAQSLPFDPGNCGEGVGIKASSLAVFPPTPPPALPPLAAHDLNQPLNGLQPGRVSSQTNVTPRRTRDQPRPAHSANRAGGNFLPSRPPDSREGLHTGSGVRVESYEGGDSHPPAPAPAGLQELTTFHFLPSRRHPCRFCPYTPVSRCLRKQIPGASSEANPTISENAPLVPLPSPR